MTQSDHIKRLLLYNNILQRILFVFISDSFVDVLGEGEGNVIAYNPQIGVTGSVCGDYWSIKNVSFKIGNNKTGFRSVS